MSPSSTYNYTSHNAVHSSPSPHGHIAAHHHQPASIPNQELLATPCQSSPHVNMGSPPSQARPGNQINITAQNNVSPPWNNTNQSNVYTSALSTTSCSNPQNGGFYSLVQDNRNFGTSIPEEKDPLSMSPTSLNDQQKQHMQSQEKVYEQGMHYYQNTIYSMFLGNKLKLCVIIILDGNVVTGQSPAQASVAPSPLRQEPQVPQPSMGAPYAPPPVLQNTNQEKQDPSKSTTAVNNRYPVVKLGRLSVSVKTVFINL